MCRLQPAGYRLAGAALLLAVAITAAALSAGCSDSVSCAGASVQPPDVALNTKAWVAAHPGAELQACIDQHCASLTGGEVQLFDGLTSDHGSSTHTLTVTATDEGHQVLAVTGKFRLQLTTLASACGDRQKYSTTIVLSSTGRLRIPAAAGQ